MPLYEFQCEVCGCCFEKLIFRSDTDPVVCPDCGEKKVKRVMSRAFCCSTRAEGQSPAAAGGGGFS
ncbi:MAG: FmdB family zinc ribbon protein [Desulfobacterales bacterium]